MSRRREEGCRTCTALMAVALEEARGLTAGRAANAICAAAAAVAGVAIGVEAIPGVEATPLTPSPLMPTPLTPTPLVPSPLIAYSAGSRAAAPKRAAEPATPSLFALSSQRVYSPRREHCEAATRWRTEVARRGMTSTATSNGLPATCSSPSRTYTWCRPEQRGVYLTVVTPSSWSTSETRTRPGPTTRTSHFVPPRWMGLPPAALAISVKIDDRLAVQ